MPAVTSLEALNHAADRFEVTDITLAIEPSARGRRCTLGRLGDGRITAGHLDPCACGNRGAKAASHPFGLIGLRLDGAYKDASITC